jgi:Tfp pilus assembly protein PilN
MTKQGSLLQLNLATEPFRRDRAILIGSGVVGVLLLATLGVLLFLVKAGRDDVRETQQLLSALDNQIAGVGKEQTTLDRKIRQPGNDVVLDRSILINTLIGRKAISWTHIFSDLETVLPWNVRVLSIRPQLNAQGQLFLDMTVAADSPEPMIGFIVKLEGSDVFGSTAVSGITPPTQNDPFYRYRLSVNYAQKL